MGTCGNIGTCVDMEDRASEKEEERREDKNTQRSNSSNREVENPCEDIVS